MEVIKEVIKEVVDKPLSIQPGISETETILPTVNNNPETATEIAVSNSIQQTALSNNLVRMGYQNRRLKSTEESRQTVQNRNYEPQPSEVSKKENSFTKNCIQKME